jgi:hypothetical protein
LGVHAVFEEIVRRMREATWGKVRRDGRERKGRKCVIL